MLTFLKSFAGMKTVAVWAACMLFLGLQHYRVQALKAEIAAQSAEISFLSDKNAAQKKSAEVLEKHYRRQEEKFLRYMREREVLYAELREKEKALERLADTDSTQWKKGRIPENVLVLLLGRKE